MKEEAVQENSAPQTEAPAKAVPSFEEQLNQDAAQHGMAVYNQTLRGQRNSAYDQICQYEMTTAQLRFKLGKVMEKRQAENEAAAATIADLTTKVADLEARLAAIMTPPPAAETVVTSAPPAPVVTDPAPASVPPPVVQSIPAVHVIQAIDATKSDDANVGADADRNGDSPSIPAASDATAPAAG